MTSPTDKYAGATPGPDFVDKATAWDQSVKSSERGYRRGKQEAQVEIDALAAENAELRAALDQSTHERINAKHYPGTRQLCSECGSPTGRCEDDSIYLGEIGPLCETCRDGIAAGGM